MGSARVALSLDGPVAHVVLDRPEARNAFDAEMVRELHDAVGAASVRDDIRVIVLAGRGSVFCAGADVGWMRAIARFTRDENLADARRLFELYETIDRSPKAVVACVQGAALGGGAGLAAVADVVVAEDGAQFGFTEVRLGLVPAVISPFVVRKIGVSAARELFLTGERFDAARAAAIGLVHRVVKLDELDAAVDALRPRAPAGGAGGGGGGEGPGAQRLRPPRGEREGARLQAHRGAARLRRGPGGPEGLPGEAQARLVGVRS